MRQGWRVALHHPRECEWRQMVWPLEGFIVGYQEFAAPDGAIRAVASAVK